MYVDIAMKKKVKQVRATNRLLRVGTLTHRHTRLRRGLLL